MNKIRVDEYFLDLFGEYSPAVVFVSDFSAWRTESFSSGARLYTWHALGTNVRVADLSHWGCDNHDYVSMFVVMYTLHSTWNTQLSEYRWHFNNAFQHLNTSFQNCCNQCVLPREFLECRVRNAHRCKVPPGKTLFILLPLSPPLESGNNDSDRPG